VNSYFTSEKSHCFSKRVDKFSKGSDRSFGIDQKRTGQKLPASNSLLARHTLARRRLFWRQPRAGLGSFLDLARGAAKFQWNYITD
jgi:hypothetical protein